VKKKFELWNLIFGRLKQEILFKLQKHNMDGGLLASWGLSMTSRKFLFYTVCIMVRTFFAVAVAVWGGEKNIQLPMAVTAAVVLGLVAIVDIIRNNKVWWNRQMHATLLAAAAVTSVVWALVPGKKINLVVSGILLSDVVFGLTDSLLKHPFSKNHK
jgi:ABC-type uncharacterized transport system permease subunit